MGWVGRRCLGVVERRAVRRCLRGVPVREEGEEEGSVEDARRGVFRSLEGVGVAAMERLDGTGSASRQRNKTGTGEGTCVSMGPT